MSTCEDSPACSASKFLQPWIALKYVRGSLRDIRTIRGGKPMSKDLNPLFGFRHLATTDTKSSATAAIQAKVGRDKGPGPVKAPAQAAVLAAKVGLKGPTE